MVYDRAVKDKLYKKFTRGGLVIKAVLFDLDGTLVHYNYEAFIEVYLSAVAGKVAGLVDPRRFVKQLMESTEAMISSLDPMKTNMEVFWDDFPGKVGVPMEVLEPVLDEFYTRDFPNIQTVLDVRPIPAARKLIEDLLEDGYEVVIATNPVFPAVAIQERMRWGGIDGLPYHLITTYETSRYCKPNVEYYGEILEYIGRKPQECIMIGNNTCEDLVAKDLGVTTYLVEDCLLDIGPFRREPDYRGSFTDLVAFFDSNVFSTTA